MPLVQSAYVCNRETKLTKTVQKLSKNSWSDRGGGGGHPPLNEYANDPLGIIISVNTAETYPQFTIFLHNFQKFRMMMIDDPRLPSQEEMIPYHGSSNTQSCTGGALPSVATG